MQLPSSYPEESNYSRPSYSLNKMNHSWNPVLCLWSSSTMITETLVAHYSNTLNSNHQRLIHLQVKIMNFTPFLLCNCRGCFYKSLNTVMKKQSQKSEVNLTGYVAKVTPHTYACEVWETDLFWGLKVVLPLQVPSVNFWLL